jgi:hypothetical protein
MNLNSFPSAASHHQNAFNSSSGSSQMKPYRPWGAEVAYWTTASASNIPFHFWIKAKLFQWGTLVRRKSRAPRPTRGHAEFLPGKLCFLCSHPSTITDVRTGCVYKISHKRRILFDVKRRGSTACVLILATKIPYLKSYNYWDAILYFLFVFGVLNGLTNC